MTDILTVNSQSSSVSFDWLIAPPSLANDDGLQSAIIISLFTDRRANDDDVISDGTNNKRGWWGDEFSLVEGDRIGSRIWLLRREKDTQETVNRLKQCAEEALQWIIEDGIASAIEVTAGWLQRNGQITETKIGNIVNGALAIGVLIHRNLNPPERYRFIWTGDSAAVVPDLPADQLLAGEALELLSYMGQDDLFDTQSELHYEVHVDLPNDMGTNL